MDQDASAKARTSTQPTPETHPTQTEVDSDTDIESEYSCSDASCDESADCLQTEIVTDFIMYSDIDVYNMFRPDTQPVISILAFSLVFTQRSIFREYF